MQRIQVLKYVVLTTMLMGSDINPFDSQETRSYRENAQIVVMTDLVDAFQRDDIAKYELTLRKNPDVLADPFIAENIDQVTRDMRTKGVLRLVAPYTRFSFKFISKQLEITDEEAQDIIGFLILDQKLQATIDQTSGTVEVERGTDVDRTRAVQHWSSAIESCWNTLLTTGEGFKADDQSQQSVASGPARQPMWTDPPGKGPVSLERRSPGKRSKGVRKMF